jgi:hypothetical protein
MIQMPTRYFVTLLFIGLIIFLIFIGWLDWIFKCRKIIKENKMSASVNGYAILGDDSVESNVCLLNGLLGVSSKELIFGHRFKDDATYFRQNISDIHHIEILEYDENLFLRLIRDWCNIQHEDIVRYVVVNMMGISTSKRIPKLVQSRAICKISVKDNCFLFCLKNTAENIEKITLFKNDIGLK